MTERDEVTKRTTELRLRETKRHRRRNHKLELESLQEKMFIATKKNHYNNIRVIAIVDTRCCNKI